VVKEPATVYDPRHIRADGYVQTTACRDAGIHYYLSWMHSRLPPELTAGGLALPPLPPVKTPQMESL
jgi:hypothetical protein